MLKKIIIFLTFSILTFANSEEALKNALDRLYGNNDKITFDIRSAKALFQPEEKIVTIQYKDGEKSGYTSVAAVGGEYSCYVTLFKGYEYAIFGAGDNTVLDVDMFIYDPLGNTVAYDRNPDPTAFALLPKEFAVSSTAKVDKSVAGTDITIRPLETQKYMVKLKLRNSNADKSSLAFLVATKWLKQ